jgi:phosphoadenosine phosphosulfate reductase
MLQEAHEKKKIAVCSSLPYKLWETDSLRCCEIYKVQPMRNAIKDLELDAIISGIRKDEGETRKDCKEIENKQGLTKYNPILHFTEMDIWKYLAVNQIPPHPWYAKGYRSLGCEPCMALVDDSRPERSGRWKGTKRCGGECQIHYAKLK